MSTNLISSGTTAREKVNLRTPDVMAAVQQQVESHYCSDIVDKVRRAGGTISVGDTTVRLAKEFGFCYGVERAIDLAYAARKVFKDRQLFIVGEIIHNPEVNHQIASLGIKNLTGKNKEADISDLGPEDVVIVPAFGTELSIQQQIKDRGCQVVDTTCGDVMSVWKRVRKYASESATSIIHGKAEHEETKATSSRALGDGSGHYVVVLTLEDTDYVCEYIRHGGDKRAFLEKFKGAHSPGFDPDVHLQTVGVANQTTMLRGETEEVQRRIRQAIVDRDGPELAEKNFRFFDTICGATQERQDDCASCSTCRWICCWWSAVTTVRTRRIWPRWVKKNCPPTSCSTPLGWFPPRRSSITICTKNAKSFPTFGCRMGRLSSGSPLAPPVRII
jgi:4-hydroxy-3-methylbut-2-enyl diphosphate reductase